MSEHEPMTHAEALTKMVGASDIPTLLGASPYRGATALRLYARVRGELEARRPTLRMRRGHALQPIILAAWSEETGRAVEAWPAEGKYLVHPDAALRLRCTPDAQTADADPARRGEPVEVKAWGDHVHADDLAAPEVIALQIQVITQVNVIRACRLSASLAGHWAVMRDSDERPTIGTMDGNSTEAKDAWEVILRALAAFWRSVETSTPPTAVGSDIDTLREIFKLPREGATVQLNGEALALTAQYRALNETIHAAEARKEEIQSAMMSQIGDAEAGLLSDGSRWTWRNQRIPIMQKVGERDGRVLRAPVQKKGARHD